MGRFIVIVKNIADEITAVILALTALILIIGIRIPKSEPFNRSHFEDVTGNMRFSDVYSIRESDWISSQTVNTTLGMSESAFWFKIIVNNPDSNPKEKVIEIPYPVLDQIDFYHVVNDSLVNGYVTGDSYIFSGRPENGRLFTFDLRLPPGSVSKIFFRIKTQSDMNVPIILLSKENYETYEELRLMFVGAFIGIFLIMILYNFFLHLYT
ncbi:MAG: hypothetical protein HQK54_11010, partial [Oligoflexales bacterium]|nr:hypothetical protein [Oligoflexales bacterium]